MVFYSISSNIDEVLSINPSANIFVFEDFNDHHKDWIIYSSGTDRSGIVQTPPPPPAIFKRGGGVYFNYLPLEGGL